MIGGGVAAPFTGGATLPIALAGAGAVLGGMGKGAADERGNVNQYNQNQDTTKANIYNTSQDALLQKLMQQSNVATSRFNTRQGAATDAMTGLQNATTQSLANASNEKVALAKLGLDAPTANAKASILGSLMKNMQPYSFGSPTGQTGHLTNMRGGMSAANLDPITREQGDLMLKDAMQKQLSGGGLPGATDFMGGVKDWKSTLLDAPESTDYSKAILDSPELSKYKTAGKGESILSGLGGALGLAGAVGGAFNKPAPTQLNNRMASSQSPLYDQTGTFIGNQIPRVNLQELLQQMPPHA